MLKGRGPLFGAWGEREGGGGEEGGQYPRRIPPTPLQQHQGERGPSSDSRRYILLCLLPNAVHPSRRPPPSPHVPSPPQLPATALRRLLPAFARCCVLARKSAKVSRAGRVCGRVMAELMTLDVSEV